jgi:hypothetical protein
MTHTDQPIVANTCAAKDGTAQGSLRISTTDHEATLPMAQTGSLGKQAPAPHERRSDVFES